MRFEPNANVVFAFEARQPCGAVGTELPYSSQWLMIEGAIALAMERTATTQGEYFGKLCPTKLNWRFEEGAIAQDQSFLQAMLFIANKLYLHIIPGLSELVCSGQLSCLMLSAI